MAFLENKAPRGEAGIPPAESLEKAMKIEIQEVNPDAVLVTVHRPEEEK